MTEGTVVHTAGRTGTVVARTIRNGREMVRLKWMSGIESGWMYADKLKERQAT